MASHDNVAQLLFCAQLIKSRLIKELEAYLVEQLWAWIGVFKTELEVYHEGWVFVALIFVLEVNTVVAANDLDTSDGRKSVFAHSL